MKKTLTSITLASILTLGATFANASDGIIVAGRPAANECTVPNTTDGIIVAGWVGVIINALDGIIVAGRPAQCNETDGIIVAG